MSTGYPPECAHSAPRVVCNLCNKLVTGTRCGDRRFDWHAGSTNILDTQGKITRANCCGCISYQMLWLKMYTVLLLQLHYQQHTGHESWRLTALIGTCTSGWLTLYLLACSTRTCWWDDHKSSILVGATYMHTAACVCALRMLHLHLHERCLVPFSMQPCIQSQGYAFVCRHCKTGCFNLQLAAEWNVKQCTAWTGHLRPCFACCLLLPCMILRCTAALHAKL